MVIETPAIIIDAEKMERNMEKYQRYATENGCDLRPHIKTHKIPRIAKMQMEKGAVGITCAKVAEAEVMAANGLTDIFIAYPVVGESKVKRFLELAKKIRMICGVDSLEGAKAISEMAEKEGVSAEVRLEIDTGFARTGVVPEKAVELGLEIQKLPNLKLTGIYTYKTMTYQGKHTDDPVAAGTEEGEMMVEVANKMREAGLDIRDVSGGSTPTGLQVAQVKGMTEIRPGTYVFQDETRAQTPGIEESDCCAVIRVTVVSVPTPHRAVVDGGTKAFAGDAKGGMSPWFLNGYGKILGHDNLVLERITEEHGMITSTEEITLKVGDQLSIIPNHICTCMNLANDVYIREKDGSYTKTPVLARGMSY